MLVPYASLLSLPEATVNGLIKEYLLTQLEDGSFDSAGPDGLAIGIEKCKQALKEGSLVVEYSEEDESIAIRPKEQLT